MTPLPHARLLIFSYFLVIGSLLGSAAAASAAEWRDRSIYQVLTDRFNRTDTDHAKCAVEDGLYCGGTWKGIEANLDYIQGMKFDAIWISPIVKQLPQQTGDGEAYTAYWAQDLYSLEPHFGTEDDLRDLIAAVHERGMYLMLDIVVNHMGYAGTGWEMDHSIINPFNESYYYHDYCTVDQPLNATNNQKCYLGDDIVTLADLRTEDPVVQQMLGEWILELVSNYSIDGLRIDTSINVEPEFFVDFVDAAGVFATGETMDGDDSIVCQWADTIGSILNYPIYYTLTRAFESSEGSIDDLVATIGSVKANCPNSTYFGSFSENHDVARFASLTDDLSLAKNIITYTIMADGIPIIYQGQEQRMYGQVDPYYNRAPLWQAGYNTSAPLYKHIATLNQFRQHVTNTSTNFTEYMAEVIYQDMHSLGMRKGYNGSQVITILNNNGQDCEYFELNVTGHEYKPDTVLTEVLTCTNFTIPEDGVLTMPMFAGTPKILYPARLLANSSICGNNAAAEPLPSATTFTTDAITTIHGHATTITEVEVSPIVPFTTHVWSTLNGLPTLVPSRVTASTIPKTSIAHSATHTAAASLYTSSTKAHGASSSVQGDEWLAVSTAIAEGGRSALASVAASVAEVAAAAGSSRARASHFGHHPY